MRSVKLILSILSIAGVCAVTQGIFAQTPARRRVPAKRVVIAASVALDGRGRLLRDCRIFIEGSKIVAVEPTAGRQGRLVDYDLRG